VDKTKAVLFNTARKYDFIWRDDDRNLDFCLEPSLCEDPASTEDVSDAPMLRPIFKRYINAKNNNCVTMDCGNALENHLKPDRREARKMGEEPWVHLGSHPWAIDKLAYADANAFKRLFQETLHKLCLKIEEASLSTDDEQLYIDLAVLFWCTWGKHRSVCVGTVFLWILWTLGFVGNYGFQSTVERLSRSCHGYNMCGALTDRGTTRCPDGVCLFEHIRELDHSDRNTKSALNKLCRYAVQGLGIDDLVPAPDEW
jgi:hypothetical protein